MSLLNLAQLKFSSMCFSTAENRRNLIWTRCTAGLVPRRLSLDENLRAKGRREWENGRDSLFTFPWCLALRPSNSRVTRVSRSPLCEKRRRKQVYVYVGRKHSKRNSSGGYNEVGVRGARDPLTFRSNWGQAPTLISGSGWPDVKLVHERAFTRLSTSLVWP